MAPHVYLATGNAHKAGEFAAIARQANFHWELFTAEPLGGMPEVQETAHTYEGNARLKAQALLPQAPQDSWVLADDSGVEVEALDDAPGLYSARYAGPTASHADNLRKMLSELQGIPPQNRRARFVCVLVALTQGHEVVVRGECPGIITETPAGKGGFGYDPIFIPDGFAQTFAELPESVKNEYSHRARAFQALIQAW